ncbi:HAMP domain-containing sensor histidine kinase [Saxibacter everestensis]|uniref:histidine kinase n=1 Tax=Saxibacter everestensis TaxID=2909229 RepID=A0ABY8QWU8_9MICO|nr:HAMP domain-containing sensor histidine kinase [Brevibacteriaceae bacterium ZFBP1038]
MPNATISRLRSESRTVRARMLAAMLAFMTAGLIIAGSVSYSLQLAALNERVNSDLLQEIDELRRVSERGVVTNAGVSPHITVDSLLKTAMQSGIPAGYESFVAIIDGKVRYLPAGQHDIDLGDGRIVRAVLDQASPDRIVTTDTRAAGETVRLAIVPATVEGDQAQGYYVIGNAIGAQRSNIYRAAQTYALVSLATVALSGLVGAVLIGRLLRPIKRLREATEQASLEDLTRRVEVPDSGDDVAQLAGRFNMMLDRLELGFKEQRRFLDDAGHELRTPLTIVRGHLEVLAVDDPEDVRQTRHLVLDELDRMQRLVHDLLLLAKARRPDFIKPGPVDLEQLVVDVHDRVRLLARRDWTFDQRAGAIIVADRERLTQALIQLAANAVKFTGAGDTIALGSAVDETEATVRLWVRDSGPGIEADDRERIFERFGRAKDVGRGVEGSGLGLSIVSAIADAHGGAVELDSVPGQGATFILVIPMHTLGKQKS